MHPCRCPDDQEGAPGGTGPRRQRCVPEPTEQLPGALLGAALVGVLLAAAAGAFLVQWAADRAKIAEVMRLAD